MKKSPCQFARKGTYDFAVLTLPFPLASLAGLDLKVQPLTYLDNYTTFLTLFQPLLEQGCK
jgi:hypothetical protein